MYILHRIVNGKRLRKSLDSRDSEILYLYLYLYDDGLQQAQPFMSMSSVLVMCVQTILERIKRCINDILWKFVPVTDHSLTEEVLS